MISHRLSYKETSCFSKFVEDYIEGNVPKTFYNRDSILENFSSQIKEKNHQKVNREILVEVLRSQNSNINLTEKSIKNIELLKEENTFTITTGHQLCLFGGPLYFFYKIISVITLTEQLKKAFPDNNFVPLFWMASEDHDVDEINHIYLFGKKYEWITDQKGMVGSFNTEGIGQLINNIKQDMSSSQGLNNLIDLLDRCYREKTLEKSTRIFINEIFGKYGIVILDPSNRKLKQQLIPIIKKDVLEKGMREGILDTSKDFDKHYKVQAFCREINFFKLHSGRRTRIVDNISEEEIDNFPERFSPNVLMRPLYQELILPNLAYIGGGAEIAYWMQLKSSFKQTNIVFPILYLRNSVLWLERKDYSKWKDLGMNTKDFFLSVDELYKKFIDSETDFSLNSEKEKIKEIYNNISQKIGLENNEGIDRLVKSEFQNQLKIINKIEKKNIKLMKMQYSSSLNQISKIKQKLFPDNILQERIDNFISFYIKHGEGFVNSLYKEINVLDRNFLILSPEDIKK